METRVRKPFEGLYNVVRFNWHYYAWSFLLICILIILQLYVPSISVAALLVSVWILLVNVISLTITAYVYDFSDLYKFKWLNLTDEKQKQRILNMNAGFDETSSLLQSKFTNAEWVVADFYDPLKHTEVSIRRARKAYPPFPGTLQVNTNRLPIEDNSIDKVFNILSAHEIRDDNERIEFFKELHRIVKTEGQIVVTEHLRNTANFLAYNIGFFHFHSGATWLKTFKSAGLSVEKELNITPFIKTYILSKNGTAS